MKQISDEQLLAAYQGGDDAAFAQLVKRYEKALYNYLLRFLGKKALAEDVFQETFLQVHVSADRFDLSRRFRPWLYTIASNKARDLLRSSARRPAMQLTGLEDKDGEGQLMEMLVRDNTTPDAVLEKKQQAELVRKAVADMPERLREILILAYFEQLSYKEMAESLAIPLGTVKSRLHSAVAHFGQQYNEMSGDA